MSAVVIDNGSGWIKAGFAGDDAPRSVFAAIVGRPKHQGAMVNIYAKDAYVGDEALAKRDLLALNNPVELGIVTNWEDMEKAWYHTFYNELRVAPEDNAVLLSDATKNPRSNREKMTQIMFETFNVPAMYVASQAALALNATGTTTGVVVDIGDDVTQITPVYEGYVLPAGSQRMGVAGRQLTNQMGRLLKERGVLVGTTAEQIDLQSIKETFGYVALDYEQEGRSTTEEKSFKLPDGQVIAIGSESFCCPEVLFCPSLAGLEGPGLAELVSRCIAACDLDVRQSMRSNIVLAGGSSLFPGLQERLQKELQLLMPDASDLQVVAPAERQYSAWRGGSMLADSSTFQENWITKEEYDDSGPAVVHRKCF